MREDVKRGGAERTGVRTLRTATIASAVLLTASAALADHATVVDGDTIRLHGETYRLHGIDAPEPTETCMTPKGGTWPCGKAATLTLQSIVTGIEVECVEMGTDANDRKVARCEAAGHDIGWNMVQSGFAWADRDVSRDYVEDEAEARARRQGIWRAPAPPASK